MEIEHIYIEGLKGGSYKDFTKLYELYAPRLYAFVFSLSHSELRAKDITQETFIKVWTLRAQIDINLSFKSYLFTIAHNQLLNELRNQLNRPFSIEDVDVSYVETTSENAIERKLSLDEFYQALDQAKQKLSPRQRKLFELSKEQGLSIAEITAITTISEGSVRNQISQALLRLRKELGNFYPLFLLFFD